MDYEILRKRLIQEYGVINWFNKESILHEIIYIIISWRSKIETANYIFKKIIDNIESNDDLLKLSLIDWENFLKESGKHYSKAKAIHFNLKKTLHYFIGNKGLLIYLNNYILWI